MTKKSTILIGSGILILSIFSYFIFDTSSVGSTQLLATVKKGEFISDIVTTGEMKAKNSVEITGPSKLRSYRIWQVTIQDMIDEGTFVQKGQYIAKLDPSELTNKISETQIELEKVQSKFIQTQLDTTLQMRESRDKLINMEYEVEEKQLILDQSQYEPPAKIKQAEIELAKSKRTLSQAKENYLIKGRQNNAKMDEISASLRKQQLEMKGMEELLSEFTIIAPEDGMLIYYKSWNGVVKTGSQIQAWNPIVATLPDLSVMLSETYVNEVDIRKINVGQSVEISLDAFPEKKLNGKVIKVANVGEQRPNSDAKVFQVSIEVQEQDDLIKPAMTTSNKIITQSLDDALFIPLECLNTHNDSITYVYKKNNLGFVKQEVEIGIANTNEVIVLKGLDKGDKLYLSTIQELDEESVQLLPELDGKRSNQKKEQPQQKEISSK